MMQEHDSIVRFPTRVCAITLALTLATFGWVVWNAYASYRDADSHKSRDLRLEEHQAFALVRDGRAEDARALLFATAYEEQKALYANGMKALLDDVRTRIGKNLQQAKQRALLSIAGSAALFGLSLAAWIAVIASLRRTQSELTRQVDNRTTALTQANQTLVAEISERREIQAELVEARDAALAGARQKTEFLANMSHEIRTPMNGVIGMTELALDTELSAQQRDAVGLLTNRRHDVTIANNGLEALAALERHAFDVVLMDVQMPDMGGLEATAAIRQRERVHGGRTRIVAMTAHAMNGDRERCLAAGMDGYLSKPIDPAMLYATLEHEAAPIAPASPPGAADLQRPATAVDRDQLMERLGGDEELLTDVIRLFLDDCPVRLAAIKAAVHDGDAERIRATAHALKGAAGNLSAQGLFDAARTLERLGAEGRLGPAQAAWRRLSMEAANVLDALRQFETVPPTEAAPCASWLPTTIG